MYRDLGSQKEEVAVDQRGESAVCVCLFFSVAFFSSLFSEGRTGDTWKGNKAAVT